MTIDFGILFIVITSSATEERLFNKCDYFVRMNANEGTTVINPGGFSIYGYFGYLGFFDPGSSCRYFIECPQRYTIQLYCSLNIAITVNVLSNIIE